MTDRIQTIREALDGGVPLLYPEHRRARHEKAEAALDSLAADLEAAREALEAIKDTPSDRDLLLNAPARYMHDLAVRALARLSTGKETGDE